MPGNRVRGLNHSAEVVSESTFSMILLIFSVADSSRYSGELTEFSWTQVEENDPQFPNKPNTVTIRGIRTQHSLVYLAIKNLNLSIYVSDGTTISNFYFFCSKYLIYFAHCRVPNTSIGLCGEQERWEEQRLSHGDREDPIQRLKLNENVSWLLYIPDNYSQTVIFVYNFFMIQTDKHTKDSICL